MRILLALVTLLLLVCDAYSRSAYCRFLNTRTSNIRGRITFFQPNAGAPTRVRARIRGLAPNSRHDVDISQRADFSNGCASTGGQFRDLRDLVADGRGRAEYRYTTDAIDLFGSSSIIGKACSIRATASGTSRKIRCSRVNQ